MEEQACALAEAGDFVLAAKLFRMAITVGPGKASLHEQLAQCLLEAGDAEAAREAVTCATELAPEWGEAYLTLARTQIELGQHQHALRSFDRCAELGCLGDEGALERAEAERRAQRDLAARTGLPQLLIGQDTGGGAGPAGVIWECGAALAEYLTRHRGPGALRGKRVLELGAGTGVVGLAAALLGAQVTMTDLPAAMPLLRHNAAALADAVAAAGGSITVAELDWASVQGPEPACGAPQRAGSGPWTGP
ncbi:hypothetical protein WJX81_005587 [Elliptochloris bilobata]|uniref:Uncharacterized protein n=1 Tax=Elliptochloris bilobata TaxID=381761 RepID=A0AAW1RF81_9CHLO